MFIIHAFAFLATHNFGENIDNHISIIFWNNFKIFIGFDMKIVLTLAAALAVATTLSGCATAVGAIASNEDVQDFAIDGALDFFDL